MFGGGFPGFFGGGGFEGSGMEEEEDSHQEEGDSDTSRLYEILGLQPQCDASLVRKAYLKACQKGEYRHPDKGGDQKKFQQLQQANDILSDPEKKRIYDKQGMAGVNRSERGGGGGGNPFEAFFGGGGMGGGAQQRKQKMKGVRKELDITLEEAYAGKMAYLQLTRKRCCEFCDGKGGANVKKCGECKGRGIVTKMVQLGPGMYSQQQAHCTKCRGEGEISDPKDQCKKCKGQKIKEQAKKLEVAIEPGCYDQYETVYTGEGDEMPGILAGDLHVRIRVKPHKVFKRKGADLYFEKQITLLESLTGFNFQINHLDGKKLTVSSIPGEIMQPNITKTVKGKGMPFFKDSYAYGNLYIKFVVKFPESGSLDKSQMEGLQSVFPKSQQKPLPKDEKEFEYLEEFHEQEMNPNAEGGHLGAEEDEYEQERGGQEGVQCQQQ